MDDYPSFSMINETVAQDVDTLPETMLVSTAQQTISSSGLYFCVFGVLIFVNLKLRFQRSSF